VANEDGAQKSIILTTSSKLTGSLLWFSSLKQSIVVQSPFLQYSGDGPNDRQWK